jgi:hypothetical protein
VFKISVAFTAISMAGRSLMLLERIVEVEPFVALWATVVVNMVTVAFEAIGSIEEAVAWTAETVPCRALVVLHSVSRSERT